MARILLHSLFKQIMALTHFLNWLCWHENACDDCFPLVPASGPIPRRGCCCTGSLESWDSGDDSTVLWSLTHDQPMGLCSGLQSGWAVWAVLPMTSGADCGSNGRWSLFTESKPTDHLEPSRCFHGTRRSGGRSHWRYLAIMPHLLNPVRC